MQKTLYFWGIALLFLAGTAVASALVIFGVMPNTADDANAEYIDIYNDSCVPIDLRGISLRDASKKTYTFASGILESGAHRKVMRTESKIILNNTDETVEILDTSGNVMHQIHYVTSFRDIPIEWEVQSPNCQMETTIEETTVETVPVDPAPIDPAPLPKEPPPPAAVSGAIVPGGTWDILPGTFAGTSTGTLAASSSGVSVQNSGGTAASSTGSDTTVPPTFTGSVSLGEWITVELGTGTGETSGSASLSGTGGSILESWPEQTGSGSNVSGSNVSGSNVSGSGTVFAQSGSVLSDSGSILFQSGTVLSGSGGTSSGTVASENTASGSAVPDATILVPQHLFLYDSDANGKIDRLSVEYSGTLSGTLQTEKLIVYSASGGLASHQIETSSGVVRHMGYSGSTLVIDLIEQDLANPALKISDTTASGLRLKTLSGFWLTSLSGIPVLPLTYTQSFDGYDGKYIHNTAVPATIPSGTATVAAAPSSVSATATAPVASGISPIRILPEPTMVFQSGVTAGWACKTANCAVNVVHVVHEKFEMCRWQMSPAWGTAQTIDGCNPRAVTLGGSGGTVGLTLLDSAGILPFKTRSFQVSPFAELPKTAMPTLPAKAKIPTVSQKSAKSKKSDVTVASDVSALKNPVPKTAANKTPQKIPLAKTAAKAKAPATKTTTVKKTTTTSKVPSAPKAPAAKVAPIAPAYQKPQSPSDSVALGIIGIACAGIGFCLSLFRKRETEPTG